MNSLPRAATFHDGYVEIELTQGKTTLVSIEDAPRVMEHAWMATCIKGRSVRN